MHHALTTVRCGRRGPVHARSLLQAFFLATLLITNPVFADDDASPSVGADPVAPARVLQHLIEQEALPYIPPPTDFPPDQWGNRIPDFSQVGYRHGQVPLPIVPVKVVLSPSADPNVDDRLRIQNAIDFVGRQPLQDFTLRDGKTVIKTRGAVLLQAGVYRVMGSLILNMSGVVLRGEGSGADGTTVIATGHFRRDFIYLHGLLDPTFQGTAEYLSTDGASKRLGGADPYVNLDGETTPVADEYVPVGTRRVPVKDISNFRVGSEIIVERRSKKAWINELGMDHIPPRPKDPSRTRNWEAKQFKLRYIRKVTAIERRLKATAATPIVLNQTVQTDHLNPERGPQGVVRQSVSSTGLDEFTVVSDGARVQIVLQEDPLELAKSHQGRDRSPQSSFHRNAYYAITRFEADTNRTGHAQPMDPLLEAYRNGAPLFESEEDSLPELFDVEEEAEQGSGDDKDDDDDDDDEEDDEGAGDDPRWTPGYLTIDVPIVMNMDPVYGGGVVYNFKREKPIPTDVGVENMALLSEYEEGNLNDEKHGWFAVMVDHCENCWVADVTSKHFVSGVKAGQGSIGVTIQDCEVTSPISLPTQGGRRYMYMLQGQQGLVKRCFASDARHDFMTSAKTMGPNVFVDSEGVRANNDAGPHDHWTTGTLYDNVRSTSLNVRNRGWMGSGQGWAGVFHVLYHCSADLPAWFQSPPGGTNWIIGFSGTLRGDYSFQGDDATFLDPEPQDLGRIPRSLYWSQLVARMGGTDATARTMEKYVGVAGKNRYPARLPQRYAAAEEIAAAEANQWPNDESAQDGTQEEDAYDDQDGDEYDDEAYDEDYEDDNDNDDGDQDAAEGEQDEVEGASMDQETEQDLAILN